MGSYLEDLNDRQTGRQDHSPLQLIRWPALVAILPPVALVEGDAARPGRRSRVQIPAPAPCQVCHGVPDMYAAGRKPGDSPGLLWPADVQLFGIRACRVSMVRSRSGIRLPLRLQISGPISTNKDQKRAPISVASPCCSFLIIRKASFRPSRTIGPSSAGSTKSSGSAFARACRT